MKTRILCTFAVFAALVLLGARSGLAATTSTVYSEDFSNGDWPPDGWTDNSYAMWTGGDGWYPAQYGDGDGGANGSIICDIWDGTQGMMLSPTVDASQWSASTDSAFLDFDFFWEYNDYNLYYGASDDNFQVYLINDQGQQKVLDLFTSTDYTYFNDSYNWIMDPPTDESAWRHYHIAIPAGYRVSDLQVGFEGNPTWGAGNAAIDNVSISGTHFNTLAVSSSNGLNFGGILIGDTSGTKSIVLKNPNPVTINISNVTINGGDFQLGYTASSLAPGTPDEPTVDSIVVFFTPSSGGPIVGALSFNTDADVPQSMSIALNGIGLAPALSIANPAELFRKTYVPLGQSVTQKFAITNSGFGTLAVNPSTYIAGDYPGEYSIASLPSSGIEKGMSDSIAVTYQPTIEGQHTAILFIESNGGEQTVQLLGTGILPRIVVTPASFNFPATAIGTQVCQDFTISNPGSDTLFILKNFFSSHDYDFSYVGLSGGDTILLPGESRTVTVCFTPIKIGTRVATVRLTTNIPLTFTEPQLDTSGFNIQIMGFGLSGSGSGSFALSKPDTVYSIVGDTTCVTGASDMVVYNLGATDITVTGLTLTSNDSLDFQFDRNIFPFVIPAHSSKQVPFCFMPSGRGPRYTLVKVFATSEGVSGYLETEVVGIGQEVCASASPLGYSGMTCLGDLPDTVDITITNCGDVATTYKAAITGTGVGDYQLVSPSTSAVVNANGTAIFQFVYGPTTTGSSVATLTISGGADVIPMTIQLTGSASSASISDNGTSGVAPVTDVGATSPSFGVVIYNTGTCDWAPGVPVVDPPFTYAGTGALPSIPGGGSTTAMFTFSPTSAGNSTKNVSFPNAVGVSIPAASVILTGSTPTASVDGSTDAQGYSLGQSYPNPVNSSASIDFYLAAPGMTHLEIVDASGNVVKTVVSGMLSSGAHTVAFDVKEFASGTYFCVLESGDVRLMRRIAVVK